MSKNTKNLVNLQTKIIELDEFLLYIGKPHPKTGLDYREISIVLTIGANSFNMKYLSEYFQENSSTMTGIIDKLVEKEVLVRQVDSSDRRAVIVSLNPKWRRKHNDHVKRQERKAKLAFEKITEERFNLLMELLSETNDRLRQIFPGIKK